MLDILFPFFLISFMFRCMRERQRETMSALEGQKRSYPLELEVHEGSCEQPNMVAGNST